MKTCGNCRYAARATLPGFVSGYADPAYCIAPYPMAHITTRNNTRRIVETTESAENCMMHRPKE